MCAFAMYDLPNVQITGYDVVSNRPKVAAYRAPGAPISSFGVESCVDGLARELRIDPLALREKNAAKEGTKAVHGPTWTNIGYLDTLTAVRKHPNYQIPLGPNQGRGIACGFWFNVGGESSAQVHVNEDGSVSVASGSPDIGGSRASMAMMAAETLGLPIERVKPIVADTASIGFTHVTGGSRVTFATGMATVQAAEKVIDQLKRRAAMIWDISPDAVDWRDGCAVPAGANAGSFDPLPLAEIAIKAARTGGPIGAEVSVNAQGAGPAFATHVCDVEVDPETGHVTVLRYTAAQDVGRAIHPSYVEGQIQGGVTQGIGWALNEEYIYDKLGRLENPGFLDYRCPVASDMPMIDPILAESAPSIRCSRCRRGADRAADGRGRQRDPCRDRSTAARPADVAAKAPRRARRRGAEAASRRISLAAVVRRDRSAARRRGSGHRQPAALRHRPSSRHAASRR